MLFLCLFPFFLEAQETEKTGNQNKIKLVYRDLEVERFDSRGVPLHSYRTQIPQIRINEGQPMDIKAATLEPYLQDCPEALRELELFRQKKKKSRESALIGVTTGIGIAFAGLAITASSEGGSIAPFGVGFGLGVGSIFYGISKGRKHRIEAYKQMEYTVSRYNRNCYDPRGKGSIIAPELAYGDTVPMRQLPNSDGINRNYEEKIVYELLENNPGAYKFISASLMGDIDGASHHALTARLGLGLDVQLGSRFYGSAYYKRALVDNFGQYSNGGENKWNVSPIIEPVDYERAQEWSLFGGIEFFGREQQVKEEIEVGSEVIGSSLARVVTEIESKRRISWSGRLGATAYRSVLSSSTGLNLSSSEAPKTEVINSFTQETRTFTFDDMDNSLVMLRTSSFSAGVSRRVIRNLEVQIDNQAFKGNKKLSYVSEWYADLLYAPSVELGDVTYFHEVNQAYPLPDSPESFTYEISPDKTPLSNIGWRLGFRSYSRTGLNLQFEMGQRPGLDNSSDMLYFSATGMYSFGVKL